MNTVRSAILRLCFLALLAFAGDRLLAWPISWALMHTQSRFARVYRGALPPSILILGNSRGVNGFYAPSIEKVAAVPTFNLSYNGMSSLVAEALFRDYLEHNPAPRLLILEVTNVVDNQDLLAGLSCFWSRSPNLLRLARSIAPQQLVATRVSHLFALNGELLLRSFYYARRDDQSWINRYRITPDLIAATSTMAPVMLKPVAENLAALGRIVALAKARGIPVRLVVTPYLPAFFEHILAWPSLLDDIRRATGESRIWDYSAAEADETHFADRLHMNDRGSDALITRMAHDGLFRP